MFKSEKATIFDFNYVASPAMPPNGTLPNIPADSTWEFRTHEGRVHTFTGTRLGVDNNWYKIIKVNFNYWGQSHFGGDWILREDLEIVGVISKSSIEMWRKLDAVESTPEAV